MKWIAFILALSVISGGCTTIRGYVKWRSETAGKMVPDGEGGFYVYAPLE